MIFSARREFTSSDPLTCSKEGGHSGSFWRLSPRLAYPYCHQLERQRAILPSFLPSSHSLFLHSNSFEHRSVTLAKYLKGTSFYQREMPLTAKYARLFHITIIACSCACEAFKFLANCFVLLLFIATLFIFVGIKGRLRLS